MKNGLPWMDRVHHDGRGSGQKRRTVLADDAADNAALGRIERRTRLHLHARELAGKPLRLEVDRDRRTLLGCEVFGKRRIFADALSAKRRLRRVVAQLGSERIHVILIVRTSNIRRSRYAVQDVESFAWLAVVAVLRPHDLHDV